jgi:ribosomal protein L5
MYGMNVTIHTSATTDEHGFELLKQFGMPFKKK